MTPPSPPEADWAGALRGPAPDEALRRLRPVLLARARATLRRVAPSLPASVADDCAQEALLTVYRRADQCRSNGAFLAWAGRVAERAALTEARRTRFAVPVEHAPPAQASADPDVVFADRDALRVTVRAAGALTERQREALRAVAVEGLSGRPAADRLGCTPNALYKAVHDARQALRRALAVRGLEAADLLGE